MSAWFRAAAPIALMLALTWRAATADDRPTDVPAKPAPRSTTIAGAVSDRDGKPVPRAWLEIRDHQDHLPSNHAKPSAAGDDGSFVFDGLNPGETYRIRACASGFAWAMTDPLTPKEDAVRITLGPARALAGRAVDADGKPLENVKISLRLAEASFPLFALTGPDGKFVLKPMGDTSGELLAIWREVEDHVCNRKRVIRRAAVSAKDDGLTITFSKGLAISGTSVAVDGKSVRRIGVQAIPVDATKEPRARADWCAARFGADGSFRIDGLEKGRYRLVGWSGDANGWSGPPAAAVSGTVEVEAGTTDVVLKLVQPR